MGRNWHKKCFACEHCQVPFGTSPFIVSETDSKPYCEKDYEVWSHFWSPCQIDTLFVGCCPIYLGVVLSKVCRLRRANFRLCVAGNGQDVAHDTLLLRPLQRAHWWAHIFWQERTALLVSIRNTQNNKTPSQTEFFLSLCSMDDYYQLFGAACAKCKEIIVGNYIESEGARWHPECHVCRYVQVVVCWSLWLVFFCLCSVCDQLIADDCIDALGSLFHPECFCCDVCKVYVILL